MCVSGIYYALKFSCAIEIQFEFSVRYHLETLLTLTSTFYKSVEFSDYQGVTNVAIKYYVVSHCQNCHT